jgi:DNA-directed RNA polymerase specialized sigma24 family protein
MTCPRKDRFAKQQANEYATVEDFRAVFADASNDLYQLSFVLTGDDENAERCLVAAREDCNKANRVFKEWACSWAKRTIIQNAIRELKPRSSIASLSSFTVLPCTGEFPSGGKLHFELDAVLALDGLERFVFVMSVLERYSDHECALLLSCPRRQIEKTRSQAIAQLTRLRLSSFPRPIRFEEVYGLNR